jgi:hypothetical protein
METYLALAHEADPLNDPVSDHVENGLRSYLRCGILAHGLARARCSSCGHEFLVAGAPGRHGAINRCVRPAISHDARPSTIMPSAMR